MPRWVIILSGVLLCLLGAAILGFAYVAMAMGAFFAPPSSNGSGLTALELALIIGGCVIILLGLGGVVAGIASKRR